jgi:hypothetical protein
VYGEEVGGREEGRGYSMRTTKTIKSKINLRK